ncbi:hypothetical protein AVEN_207776-1 [Araneus ventricosus]|uniref:Uncharacterized protein n=1 Tax=Araneus ventricosus TaxID=182803 RepID=A0A4Y2BZQ6_ARAVE|nr:hypothetical protein AVEN_207776-1 [Araneus ventricosus]
MRMMPWEISKKQSLGKGREYPVQDAEVPLSLPPGRRMPKTSRALHLSPIHSQETSHLKGIVSTSTANKSRLRNLCLTPTSTTNNKNFQADDFRAN